MTPMLAVYATATVRVTVAAGTRCAREGLMDPLDAEQSPPGPETLYQCCTILYYLILPLTNQYHGMCFSISALFLFIEHQIVSYCGQGFKVYYVLGCIPPPRRFSWVPAAVHACYRAPPQLALRRGVKRYLGPSDPVTKAAKNDGILKMTEVHEHLSQSAP